MHLRRCTRRGATFGISSDSDDRIRIADKPCGLPQPAAFLEEERRQAKPIATIHVPSIGKKTNRRELMPANNTISTDIQQIRVKPTATAASGAIAWRRTV